MHSMSVHKHSEKKIDACSDWSLIYHVYMKYGRNIYMPVQGWKNRIVQSRAEWNGKE